MTGFHLLLQDQDFQHARADDAERHSSWAGRGGKESVASRSALLVSLKDQPQGRTHVWSKGGRFVSRSCKDRKQKRGGLARDKITPSFQRSLSRNGMQGPLKKKSGMTS